MAKPSYEQVVKALAEAIGLAHYQHEMDPWYLEEDYPGGMEILERVTKVKDDAQKSWGNMK